MASGTRPKLPVRGAGPFQGPRGKVEAEVDADLKLGSCL